MQDNKNLSEIEIEDQKIIENKVGVYNWKIGADGNAHRDTLMSLVTLDALTNLVKFNKEALGLASVLKPGIIKK